MRGFGVVFTLPVAHKGISIACKRNTMTVGLEENIVHPILMSVTMKKSMLMGSSCTISNLVFGSTRSEPLSCQASG